MSEMQSYAFESLYSGFIGILPYTSNEARKEENFLYMLKKEGLIDHMTVAFYLVNDALNKSKVQSTIKFGSMDTINLKSAKGTMFSYRTINKTTWNLRCNSFALGTNRLGDMSEISFEP
jgi:hypothetical protein